MAHDGSQDSPVSDLQPNSFHGSAQLAQVNIVNNMVCYDFLRKWFPVGLRAWFLCIHEAGLMP